eukprot:1137643-Prymnesium_polylepis.1
MGGAGFIDYIAPAATPGCRRAGESLGDAFACDGRDGRHRREHLPALALLCQPKLPARARDLYFDSDWWREADTR